MTFLLGHKTEVYINDTPISSTMTEVTMFLDPNTGWNLVVEGFFDNETTMVWADNMRSTKLIMDDRISYEVDVVWVPDSKSKKVGKAFLKNFKVISNVEDVMTYKLHLREIRWNKKGVDTP
mgnify:CR=1 FL=1